MKFHTFKIAIVYDRSNRLWLFKNFGFSTLKIKEFSIDENDYDHYDTIINETHKAIDRTISRKKKEKRKSIYSKVLEENWLRKKKKRKEIKWERKFWYYFGGKIFFEKLLLIIFVPQRCIFVSNDPWKQNEIVSRIHNFLLFWVLMKNFSSTFYFTFLSRCILITPLSYKIY